MGFLPVLSNASQISSHTLLNILYFLISWVGVSLNSGQVEPMPYISYDTAFEVALSTRFILYYILERAYKAA
jgi:hypothetical protein